MIMLTKTRQDRAEAANPLWHYHGCLNKLIAAAAFAIIEGTDPVERKEQLFDEIQALSAKYLKGQS